MKTVKPQKSLVEQTYDILVDAICTGTLRPGERLTQDDIAARLNVSRQPVNAAIGLLKANRLVESTGRRGVVVSPLDADLFRSIYEFRGAVEPLAVELAGRVPISRDDKREGEDIVAAGWDALHRKNTGAMVEADVAFHTLIYRLSGNSVIEETMKVYWTHIRRAMAEILRGGEGYPALVWQQHESILADLVSGKAAPAAKTMQQHILGSFTMAGVGRLAKP